MKSILVCMTFAIAIFGLTNAWAASSQTVTVNATVAAVTGGLTIAISKVDSSSGVWTPNQTAVNFGTLNWDSTNKIFMPTCYYALDISVTDNTGTAWTLTHTRASLANGANNLNNKVNVSFNKQTDGSTATELQKVSYGNSQNVAYTKAQLSGGWLRIYYGIGTGQSGKDAPGVTPIGLDTLAGTYTGSVTITLTP
jgi:hypothetical protein